MSETQWEEFLRTLTFRTYDSLTLNENGVSGGAKISWGGSEKLIGTLGDHWVQWKKSDGGNDHWYHFVFTDTPTKDYAMNLVKNSYNPLLGKSGFLPIIQNASENVFLQKAIFDHWDEWDCNRYKIDMYLDRVNGTDGVSVNGICFPVGITYGYMLGSVEWNGDDDCVQGNRVIATCPQRSVAQMQDYSEMAMHGGDGYNTYVSLGCSTSSNGCTGNTILSSDVVSGKLGGRIPANCGGINTFLYGNKANVFVYANSNKSINYNDTNYTQNAAQYSYSNGYYKCTVIEYNTSQPISQEKEVYDSDIIGTQVVSNRIEVEEVYTTIAGTVWAENDRDGIYQTSDEAVIEGVAVTIYDASGTQVATTTTNKYGKYSFNKAIPNQKYSVEFSNGTTNIRSYNPTVKDVASENHSDVNTNWRSDTFIAVYQKNAVNTINCGIYVPSTLSGMVWDDSNRDGIYNNNEAKIKNANVAIMTDDGTPATNVYGQTISGITTDSNGNYTIPELEPRTSYTIKVMSANGTNLANARVSKIKHSR